MPPCSIYVEPRALFMLGKHCTNWTPTSVPEAVLPNMYFFSSLIFILFVLAAFCFCDETLQETAQGERVYFSSHFQVTAHHLEGSEQALKEPVTSRPQEQRERDVATLPASFLHSCKSGPSYKTSQTHSGRPGLDCSTVNLSINSDCGKITYLTEILYLSHACWQLIDSVAQGLVGKRVEELPRSGCRSSSSRAHDTDSASPGLLPW